MPVHAHQCWSFLFYVLPGAIVGSHGFPILDTSSTCFSKPKGFVDRSSFSVALAVRGWISHELCNALLIIVLKEYLRYTVVAYNASSADPKQWGEDMADKGYWDIDIETGYIAQYTHAYATYIATGKVVKGELGYAIRKGLYVTNDVVRKQPFATWHKFYSNFSNIQTSNFANLQLANATLQYIVSGFGITTPVCDPLTYSWCGTGNLSSFWVSPTCSNDTSKCTVVLMEDVGIGPQIARMEQLTSNHGLHLIHGYAGRAMTAWLHHLYFVHRKQVLFVTDNINPLIQKLKAERVSFPDWNPGCSLKSTQLPTGSIECDFGHGKAEKLKSERLRPAKGGRSEIYHLLEKFSLMIGSIEEMIESYTISGSTPHQVACRWLKSADGIAWIATTVSGCIVKPGSVFFDPHKLECGLPATLVQHCHNSSQLPILGHANYNVTVIRICSHNWVSHSLVSWIAAFILKDYLKLNVFMVDLSALGISSENTIWDLAHARCYADMEHWFNNPETVTYKDLVITRQLVDHPGQIGYAGRSGLYVSTGVVMQDVMSAYWKFYSNATNRSLKSTLPTVGQLGSPGFPPTMRHADPSFPTCSATWCEQSSSPFYGYWVPYHCANDTASCAVLIHETPTYATGFFEALTTTMGLPFSFAYYGTSMGSVLKTFAQNGRNFVHFGYEPDPLHVVISSVRISFPDWTMGCTKSYLNNNKNPLLSSLTCDYKHEELQILLSRSLRQISPKAYYVLANLRFSYQDIESMFQTHQAGKGNETSKHIACEWVKNNERAIRQQVAPDCITKPKPMNSLLNGDEYFDAVKRRCATVACAAAEFIKTETTLQGLNTVSCVQCGPGSVPSRDKRSCRHCHVGRFSNRTSGSCQSCPRGHSCLAATETPKVCGVGTYAPALGMRTCLRCQVGKFQSWSGQSYCFKCPDTFTTPFASADDITDCQCSQGTYTTSNVSTNVTRRNTRPSNTTLQVPDIVNLRARCIACPDGMTCGGGISLPRLKIGFTAYTHECFPVLHSCVVYRCAPSSVDKKFCPGGMPGCQDGRSGHTCHSCEAHYRLEGTTCKSCGPKGWRNFAFPIVVLSILLAMTIFMYWFFNHKPMPEEVVAAMVIKFCQSVSVVSNFDVDWPKWVTDISDRLGVLRMRWQQLMEDSDLAYTCNFGWSFKSRYLPLMMFPVVQALLFFICWYASVLLGRLRCARSRNRRLSLSKNKVINAIGKLTSGFFISTNSLSVMLFLCYEHPGGHSSSLKRFPDTKCYSDEWFQMLPVALVLGIGCYTVGFYSVVVYICIIAPKRFSADLDFRARFKFIWGMVREDRWWYMCLTLTYGINLNLISAFITSGMLQLYLTSVIIFFYSIILFWLKPWRYPQAFRADLIVRGGMLLILLVGTSYANGTVDTDKFAEGVARYMYYVAVLAPALLFLYTLLVGLKRLFFTATHHIILDNELPSHVRRFTQMAWLTTCKSDDEILMFVKSLGDFEKKEILEAVDLMTASMFGFQPGAHLSQNRLIPNSSAYVVATERLLDREVQRLALDSQQTYGSLLDRRKRKMLTLLHQVVEAVIHAEGNSISEELLLVQKRSADRKAFLRKRNLDSKILGRAQASQVFLEFAEEFKLRAPSEDEVDFVFAQADKHHRNCLRFTEVIHALSIWQSYIDIEPLVNAIFKKYDSDIRGTLRRQEIRSYLARLNDGLDVSDDELRWVMDRCCDHSMDHVTRVEMCKLTTLWLNRPISGVSKAKNIGAMKDAVNGSETYHEGSKRSGSTQTQGTEASVHTAETAASVHTAAMARRISQHFRKSAGNEAACSGRGRMLQILEAADYDEHSPLDQEDFSAALMVALPKLDQALHVQIFEMVDTDNSGKATLFEFAQIAGWGLEAAEDFGLQNLTYVDATHPVIGPTTPRTAEPTSNNGMVTAESPLIPRPLVDTASQTIRDLPASRKQDAGFQRPPDLMVYGYETTQGTV